MIRIQSEPIDYHALTEAVRSHASGAVCLFLGTVREFTGAEQTAALTYEAHPVMAPQLLSQVEQETRQQWPVHEVILVHRTGYLELGEISVAVVISAGHRDAAFASCRFAIDRLKEIVPIWKQDHANDGKTTWIHPELGQ
ncbi:MAG: molybdenum cofactor biosynthesis protein MoaE [Planctomycetia bacterium]|nr:molybdenum cofactor biosynthesis protein MoaE [Planctomycetia bacterium]